MYTVTLTFLGLKMTQDLPPPQIGPSWACNRQPGAGRPCKALEKTTAPSKPNWLPRFGGMLVKFMIW